MESNSQAQTSVTQDFSRDQVTSIMAITHHVMDELLDKFFERLQLQLKWPLKSQSQYNKHGQVKGGNTAITATGIRGQCYGSSYKEDCQEGKKEI